MLYRFVAAIVLTYGLFACIPPSEKVVEQPVVIDLADPRLQQIYELQNERAEDSLRHYLSAPEASHRYLAARALGSFPSLQPATLDSLAAHLNDDMAVRIEAAYALGQSGAARAAGSLARAFDRTGRYPAFNATVLAAVGKSADAATARQLAEITTYTVADTALMAGRLWGIYYAALRGHHGPAADATVVDVLTDPLAAPALRRPAAHYLYRIDVPLDTATEGRLLELLRRETDPEVNMGIIRSLGRTGNATARAGLLRHYETAEDWRQRVEVLRALEGFEYAAVRESVLEALRDRHPLVARTAAEYFISQGETADAPFYLQLAEDQLTDEVSTLMYRAANRHLAPFLTDYRDRMNNALRTAYGQAVDSYARAEIIRALGEFPWMYRVLYTYYREAESPVERTATAEALRTISERDDFDAFFRGSARRVRSELANYFREMIASADDGPAYHAALAIASAADTYRPVYTDSDWLDTATESFTLPRQIEAYREVVAARNALRQTEGAVPEVGSGSVRQIEWARISGDAELVVNVATSEGDIRIRLWPKEAPATVSSFLELVEGGYYDDKRFHRVVPNFVAQGGGPRGDGMGAEDFTVRTETPMVHWDRPGLVGMASAGKDTEGVQFFITHRPTPHLDGKYTIFGEVIEGQEVVDRLVPGSPINRISLR
ncbi:cyclophilin family peptidyl-prolyl cis-trans isomerase [Neolewinella xylanilytica]|uniref:peptidylprolyl isomerase n=1 Tax=Neolewinella xylanilytica TaxID=1514080 RepID=A0A2S6I3R7_9BACT|nr:peptidylprolyl isomerase [Neolewinella xylanilytica]PPK85817.1 cyclophilin family peptidyl-prolyl cis-trans isomerase [Neolewinella xylanilytica]